MSEPNILVLGVGNLVMGDDGAGVRVVQRLQSEYRMPGHVEIMDGGTLGLDILPRLDGVGRLLMVDAVETGHGPGTCVRLAGEEIPLVLENRISPHQMGIRDLLGVARLIGSLPQEIVLIGVQPGNIEMGTELTPDVEAKVDVMLSNTLKELQIWGVRPEPV
ncbi:MAG: hydrogenase expression/formation protein [Geobacter sp.]|nr:MAG: hydrogenase expression/formation protein [Geobacter sp.]